MKLEDKNKIIQNLANKNAVILVSYLFPTGGYFEFMTDVVTGRQEFGLDNQSIDELIRVAHRLSRGKRRDKWELNL